MQEDIFMQFGIKNLKIVRNGIDACKCNIATPISEKSNTVLFAGRSTGKGFEKTCQLVKSNPAWTLLAAGDSDLRDTALLYLSEEQFKYLGFLPPETLFLEIHKAYFVSVLSECFDVYPTIALEAFMHGSNVISSDSTGVTELIHEYGTGHILKKAEMPNLDILKIQSCSQPGLPLSTIDVLRSAGLYKSIMSAALFPIH
jgi:glycosyltransferase involved in cell wall biosynthesis